MYSLRNRPEKLAKGSLFRLFLKLVQIIFLFTDNVRILYIYLVFILTYYTIIHLSGIYIDILHYHTFIWYLYWHITLSYIYLVFILTYYTIIHLSGIYIDILHYHTFIWYLYWHITPSYIYLLFINSKFSDKLVITQFFSAVTLFLFID